MRTSALVNLSSRSTAFLTLQFIAFQAFAQDKGLDVNVEINDKSGWASNVWIWIGVAAFIIILVLAMRAGGSTSKD